VTDTMPLSVSEPSAKIDVVTVAPMIAEAIMRIHKDLSISALSACDPAWQRPGLTSSAYPS
jgi:phosphoribosylpyrophosphate synthetase